MGAVVDDRLIAAEDGSFGWTGRDCQLSESSAAVRGVVRAIVAQKDDIISFVRYRRFDHDAGSGEVRVRAACAKHEVSRVRRCGYRSPFGARGQPVRSGEIHRFVPDERTSWRARRVVDRGVVGTFQFVLVIAEAFQLFRREYGRLDVGMVAFCDDYDFVENLAFLSKGGQTRRQQQYQQLELIL